MAQPPTYNRQASFANLQALNPSGQPPGTTMDAEYNAIKTTLDATLANLALIQNDDTTLGNETVGPAQLSSQLTAGFTSPSAWVTGHAYTASPASTVLHGTGMYICLVSHTSGAFATDLTLGKWLLIFDLSTLTFGNASQIAVTSHGSDISSNVQTSLNALDDNKAALSHTHTASQISDSSLAGRNMITAANVAAQQALLGLGSLAFLNSLPVITSIPGELAFPGDIASGLLGSNQNDFTPTGWATNAVLRFTSSVDVVITGFAATTDGDLKFIENTNAAGTFKITIAGNSTFSAASNRVATASPLVLRPGNGVTLQYDGTNSIWRVVSKVTSEPTKGSTRNLIMGNVASFINAYAPSSPNTQVYAFADEVVLEDADGNTWNVVSTAQADATVAGANGIDAALVASTWYSMWIIGNPSSNVVAALISLSATAPTMPAGYTFKARVGWMRTDGSAHFLKILQIGRTARYTGTMPAITGASGIATVTPSIVNYVPPTAAKIAVILAGAVAAGQTASVGATASSSPQQISVQNTTGGGTLIAQYVADITLETSTIAYTSNTAGTSVNCYGWEDNL